MGVPSKPTFFKFILDPDVHATGLRIPKKFMREHGKNLSNRVFLKVPDGAIWQVEMTTNSQNGEVWLKKGWREFAVHYSIVYTSCLLFKYESNSTFLVIIFDSSASEIEYPTSREPGIEIEREDEELNQNGGSYIDTETNTGVNVAVSADTEEDSEDKDDKRDIRIKRKREASENEMCNALRLAKAFKSGNPFFLVRMQPSYVSSKSGVVIPPSFVQRNMNKRHNNVVLQVISKGRNWKAKYMVYAYSAMLSTAVWKKFVKDNSLTIGDVCVFELIDDVENLLEVHIFRAMKNKTISSGPDIPNAKRKTCSVDNRDSTGYETGEDSREEDDQTDTGMNSVKAEDHSEDDDDETSDFWIMRKQDAPSENEKANALQLAKAYKSDLISVVADFPIAGDQNSGFSESLLNPRTISCQ